MTAPKYDWKALEDIFKEQLQNALSTVLIGVKTDVEAYAQQITLHMLYAAQQKRPELLDELREQSRMLLAQNRVRTLQGEQELVGNVILSLVNIAVKAISLA